MNTAITLPIGVEAYGAYALGAWLTPGTLERARTFARNSAIGALVLGMLGQVVYHLLAASHAVRAPWPVVVLVSCLPVVTLGFGAALTHLLREPVHHAKPEAKPATEVAPSPVSSVANATAKATPGTPGKATGRPSRTRQRGASRPDMEKRARGVLARQPEISRDRTRTRLGASPRTGQRLLVSLNGDGQLLAYGRA